MYPEELMTVSKLDVKRMKSKQAILKFVTAQMKFNLRFVLTMKAMGLTYKDCIEYMKEQFLVVEDLASIFEEGDKFKEMAGEARTQALHNVLDFIDETYSD